MKSPFVLAILIVCTAFACADKTGHQIQSIFTRNMELEKETAPKVEALLQIRNNINVQGRALTEEEISLVEEIGVMEQRWLDWQKAFHARDLVQVEKNDRKAFLQEQHDMNATIMALKSDLEDMLSNPF